MLGENLSPETYKTKIYKIWKIISDKKITSENKSKIIILSALCNSIITKFPFDDKILKYTKNLKIILSKFKSKNELIDRGKKYDLENGWIFKQLSSVCKDKKDVGIQKRKLKILLDKMSFYHSSIVIINKILNFAYEKLEKYMDLNNEKIIINLKLILKSTENYNISKLKRAAKKFEQSKKLRDFKFGRMKPKLAHLLSSEDAFKVDGNPKKVPTPFGPIWIQRSKNDNDNSRMIYIDKNCKKAPTYDEICENLDKEFQKLKTCNREEEEKEKKEIIDNLIKPIIDYVNQDLDTDLLDIKDIKKIIKCKQSNFKFSKDKDNDFRKNCAACLCGTLLFSESHEIRNPTGGKFERKAMDNVLKLAEDGCDNPFGVVFDREKGRYIPARSDKMPENETGGVKQTKIILEFLTKKNLEEITGKSIQQIINEYKISIRQYFNFDTSKFNFKTVSDNIEKGDKFETLYENIENFTQKFKKERMKVLLKGLILLLQIKYEKKKVKDISVKPLELLKKIWTKIINYKIIDGNYDYNNVKNDIDDIYSKYSTKILHEVEQYKIESIKESNYKDQINFLIKNLKLSNNQIYYLIKLKKLYEINAGELIKASDLPTEPSDNNICKIINQAIRDSKKINKLMNNSIKKIK